jgi:regulatory protein
MIITKIEKKDNTNVIIYLDNGEKIYLAYEVILKNGLRKGVEISESHFHLLITANQKYFIKKKAYDYLGKRIHSAYELRTKLIRKKYDSDLINEIIDELTIGNYVDDSKFAEIFTEEKIRLKSWGKTKLKSELAKRGITSDIISNVLLNIFPLELEEFELAFQLAKKKFDSLKNRNLEKRKLIQKMYSFLLSKGYNFDISKKVVEKLLSFSADEELSGN